MTAPIEVLQRATPVLNERSQVLASDQARVLLATFLLGQPSPAALPPRLATADALLRRMFARPPDPAALDVLSRLPDAEHDELLELAAAFVPAAQAAALFDRLIARGATPTDERLAALLAVHDRARCDELLARVAASALRTTPTWIDLVAAVVLAAMDAGRPVPDAARRAWEELNAAAPNPWLLPTWLTARLRMQARVDPVAALAAIDDASDEVGGAEIATGVTSVIARAAALDREAVWTHLSGARTMTHRACVLATLTASGPIGAREEAALTTMFDELHAPRTQDDSHPREIWVSAVALLELAAATGRVDLGVRTIAAAGPPPWTIFIATREPALDRAVRCAHWDPELWDRLAEAALAHGPGRAAATNLLVPPWAELDAPVLAALWQVETLPRPELVWHRAWGSGLP